MPNQPAQPNTNQARGIITSVNGQIATIEIEGDNFPELSEILTSPEDPGVILEVFSQSRTALFAAILSSSDRLYRGMKIVGSGSDLKIPVGPESFGPGDEFIRISQR